MGLPDSIGRLKLLLTPMGQQAVFLIKHDSLYKEQFVLDYALPVYCPSQITIHKNTCTKTVYNIERLFEEEKNINIVSHHYSLLQICNLTYHF